MKLTDTYVVKKIVGNTVVIPIGQAYMDGKENICLNTEGTFFVKHIVAGKSEEEIIDLYADLFSEDFDIAREKLDEFLEYGRKQGFIE
jgi:hypothetical protein